MIDYHVILKLFIDQNENNVQTRGGHTSTSQGKKRNETSVIGREERKKEDGIYFHKLLRSVFLKEFSSSPSTPNKQ